jgi:serine phosphatase RsbU (regulator of sigma subunit)
VTDVVRMPVVATAAGIPAKVYDPARLAAVAATGMLDTAPEESLDDLAELAAVVTGASLAFVALVGARRSFWKAVAGPRAGEIVRRDQRIEYDPCHLLVATDRELIAEDARADARLAQIVAGQGVGAWAGFPIHGRSGHVLGGLYVVDDAPRPWSAEQVRGLRTLARAVSTDIGLRQALANAELRVSELTYANDTSTALAKTLQDSLLPPVIVRPPGVEAAALYLPAAGGIEVVGDFFDLFRTRDDWWCAVMGDVCGKGIEAAKITALARYTVRAEATQHTSPAKVMSRLNDALLRQKSSERFLTALCITFRTDGTAGTPTGITGRISSAGHPLALLRRADGTVTEIGRHGTALGLLQGVNLTADPFTLTAGDALLLYTDGVTEARAVDGGALFGEERLIQVFADCGHDRSAEQIADSIIESVLEYTGARTSDDTALLLLRVPETPSP